MTTSKQYSLKKVSGDGKFDYIDQDGISWDSPKGWLWIGVLGGCGCGSTEELEDLAFSLLEDFSYSGDDWDKRKLNIYDDLALEVLAHWMDDAGLTEHGTSISGSWLTDKGEQVYKTIKELL